MATNIVFPPNSSGNPGFLRHETMLTPLELKRRYLHGVDFRDNNGVDLNPSVFQDAISDAVSEVEHELNLTITPTTFTQRIDYDFNDYNNFGFIQLDHKPVISVTSVKLQLIQGETLVEFPSEWIRVYNETGQIQITPTSGTVAGFSIGNSGFLPTVYGVTRNFPQMIEVVYVAGFEQNKIPKVVNSVVGMNAAIPLLVIAGDLIIGAGISSQTISLDGLSQTVNSTLSAENTGYGGRIREYRKELESSYKVIKNYYHGINFRIS